jgi:hypothetical protein
MEIIEMRGLLFCTAEKHFGIYPAAVYRINIDMSDLKSQRRSLNHADCRLTATPSECGDKERITHI